MKLRYFHLVFATLLLVSCSPSMPPQTPPEPEQASVTLMAPGGQKVVVTVEIADDSSERARGLMERDNLPDGHGMLFIFDAPESLSFWMKNTKISLDIIYFDADGTFVSSATMEPCEEVPCPLYPSEGDAMYALEVPAGFAEEHGVGGGWKLVFEQKE